MRVNTFQNIVGICKQISISSFAKLVLGGLLFLYSIISLCKSPKFCEHINFLKMFPPFFLDIAAAFKSI
jgi:hypothetical protein